MKKLKIIIISVAAVIICLCTVAALLYFGVLHINKTTYNPVPNCNLDIP